MWAVAEQRQTAEKDTILVYPSFQDIQLSIMHLSSLYSRCSFSMMVKWENDGLHQANDGEMLDNDG